MTKTGTNKELTNAKVSKRVIFLETHIIFSIFQHFFLTQLLVN